MTYFQSLNFGKPPVISKNSIIKNKSRGQIPQLLFLKEKLDNVFSRVINVLNTMTYFQITNCILDISCGNELNWK